jgi:NADH:ubiquinone oxidoreductase subunit 6 (subunit J)
MPVSEIILNVLFYVFAAGAIGGAAAVALSKNIVRSAFALLAVLVSVAAMYALMKADFIAAAQVLIYVGGILVLIIFAVMLTHRITDVKMSNDSGPGLAAACACFCFLFSVVLIILALPKWRPDPFQRGAEEVVVRAGGVELILEQWQADGRTGLKRGADGATHEPAVVLAVRVRKGPQKDADVEFQISELPGWDKKNSQKVALQDGAARWAVEKLRHDKSPLFHWRVRLTGKSGEVLVPWTRGEDDATADFTAHKGVTRLAALGLSGRYLFAFEVVSVLLLAALVGAAFLARKEVKEA